MATGVLPLLLGKYTRLAQFFGQAAKAYTGEITFGWATDSFDAEGERVGDLRTLGLGLAELQELAKHFSGEMDQMPPVFSAKKIGGVPAHKLARAGKDVPVKPARIFIHHFELLSLAGDTAEFAMEVSAGGYVRSVAHELGQMAGCGAHLSALRRVRAGAFDLSHAITVPELKALSVAEIEAKLPHPRTLLPEIPAVMVDEGTANKLRNGMQANVAEFSNSPMVKVFTGPRELLCVARRVAGTLVQPFVVMG
jgi:tRNA pseudouridine55 synthase